jgi:hypothetical protein
MRGSIVRDNSLIYARMTQNEEVLFECESAPMRAHVGCGAALLAAVGLPFWVSVARAEWSAAAWWAVPGVLATALLIRVLWNTASGRRRTMVVTRREVKWSAFWGIKPHVVETADIRAIVVNDAAPWGELYLRLSDGRLRQPRWIAPERADFERLIAALAVAAPHTETQHVEWGSG